MHNGEIPGHDGIHHYINDLIASALYRQCHSATNSETFFLVLQSNGLIENPKVAFEKSVVTVKTL